MPRTFLPVLIEASCANHPQLARRYQGRLPAWTRISVSDKKLFGYACMKFQDASIAPVKSYQNVRAKAASLLDLYGHSLTYGETGIDIHTDSELTGSVSELVGIGAGLAGACEVFNLNPNRISRFITNTTGKRMDYEFTVGGKSHLLEVRGTTVVANRGTMIAAVGPKKSAPASRGYATRAGTVTLYAQGGGNDHVTIVDPPGEGGDAGELDEMANIFEYYHNVYRLTHTADELLLKLQSWLDGFRRGEVLNLPSPPDSDEIPRPRITSDVAGAGVVGGTYFDRRVLQSSIERFASFDEATASFVEPTWLVGTMPELNDIFASGDWTRLLEYSEAAEGEDQGSPSTILRSGLVVAPVRLSEYEESLVRLNFASLRRRYEAAIR